MNLINKIKELQQEVFTLNGQKAVNTLNNPLLDLFSTVGSLRNTNEKEIALMFLKSFIYDPLYTLKLAFYARDIKMGLGERKTSRIMFKVLGELYPEVLEKNINLICEYGRFDDLLCLLDTKSKDVTISVIKNILEKDNENMLKGMPISLLAKWLPSINTSSYKTREYANIIASSLNLKPKMYRKMLSQMRNYINITEKRMSQKEYNLIKYDAVSSLAMNRYYRAFERNDEERFSKYKESLLKGETKINSSVLFPYDITYKVLYGNEDNLILEKQWQSLPNYVEGENNVLIMADVSGSMDGKPMASSVGLALYFAEHNKGLFHNKFMTFSEKPELVEVKGNTLKEKIVNISNANWGMNTNLEAAFNLILDAAIKSNASQTDLPKSLVIISDMQIDYCTSKKDKLFYDEMKERFKDAGYDIPNVVFWNVNNFYNAFHIESSIKGVQLVSGQSATTFKTLLDSINLSPLDYMYKILDSERYKLVKV